MPHPLHPVDERLAALAGDEAEALHDAELTSHVASCDRCGPMVEDLRELRASLAELPDVAPSRPLRLIPPVPETPERDLARGGWVGALAWLTGPAMAAGVVLILVGAIGTASSGLGTGAAGARPNAFDAAAASAGRAAGGIEQLVPAVPSAFPSGVAATAVPPRTSGSQGSDLLQSRNGSGALPYNNTNPGSPWLPTLGVGVALLAVGFLARGYVRRVEGAPGN